MSKDKDKDDEIGYGKPPKKTQFKAGQSGNPKGRPKGRKNFSTYLEDMLQSKVPVTRNGKTVKFITVEASLARLREQALKGNPRALEKLLDYAERYGAEQNDKEVERQLTREDQAIFDDYEGRIRAEERQGLMSKNRLEKDGEEI